MGENKSLYKMLEKMGNKYAYTVPLIPQYRCVRCGKLATFSEYADIWCKTCGGFIGACSGNGGGGKAGLF